MILLKCELDDPGLLTAGHPAVACHLAPSRKPMAFPYVLCVLFTSLTWLHMSSLPLSHLCSSPNTCWPLPIRTTSVFSACSAWTIILQILNAPPPPDSSFRWHLINNTYPDYTIYSFNPHYPHSPHLIPFSLPTSLSLSNLLCS